MNLKDKRVAVFGMGKSGFSALKLLHREGAETWAISRGDIKTWDNSDDICNMIGEDHCIEEGSATEIFENSELIILSPGISKAHPSLAKAHDQGVKIWSEIELGFQFAKAPIIALTGSNGKTTTVSLIGEMLKHSGKSVFVGGNIGTPFCEYALGKRRERFILLELSSFQLESMENFRPHIAVIMNVFYNHGERYDSIEEYAHAKFNITNRMTKNDHLVVPQNFPLIYYWAKNEAVQQSYVDTDQIDEIKAEILINYSLGQYKLHGDHNIVNLYFAIKSLELLNITGEGIQKAIDTFPGVPHRLQYIETDDAFTSYNDAKSTNWDALLTAVKSIDKKERELYVIVGGQKRGKKDSITPHLEALELKVDKLLLVGDTTEMFATEIGDTIPFEKSGTIENAVQYVRDNKYNGILLLSPAFPSYDQFENYIIRGERFIEILKED